MTTPYVPGPEQPEPIPMPEGGLGPREEQNYPFPLMQYPEPRYVVPTSGTAVAGMILGIISWLTFCIPFLGAFVALLAVLIGHMGYQETKNGSRGGHGMSIAALLLGGIALFPAVFFAISAITGAASS